MIAELKIYEDCSSKEPTKVYPLYQITTRVSKQMADFKDKYDNNFKPTADDYEEVMNDLDDLIRKVFPKITDEELEDTSLENKMEFVWAVVNHFNGIANKTLKNS